MRDESVSTQKDAIGLADVQSQQRWQCALELHRTGNLVQAQAIYEAILARQPRHSDAINLLGAIAVRFNEEAPEGTFSVCVWS